MPTRACGVMIGAELRGRHGRTVEDPDGRRVVGVAERGAHHEAVELRFGEPVGAGLLDGVLRSQHEEGHADLTGDAVDRDAALLHDLEKGGLRLRARPVDLVGEHDVREDRPGVELEGPLLLVVHADAGDVARQQVGGELDARVRALHRLRHRARQRRLARAGDVLQQHVAVAQHRGEDEFDDVALAEHGPLDVVGELAERLREPGRLLLRDRHGRCPSVVTVLIVDAAALFAALMASGDSAGRAGSRDVRVACRRERRRRGRQAPALRRPVDRHGDPLDADGADRNRPAAGGVGAARRPTRRSTAGRCSRTRSQPCRRPGPSTSRPVRPGRTRPRTSRPPARLDLVGRAAGAGSDARPRRGDAPSLVDVAHLQRGIAVEHASGRDPSRRTRRGSGTPATGGRPKPARSRSARTSWSPTCRGKATTTRTRSS